MRSTEVVFVALVATLLPAAVTAAPTEIGFAIPPQALDTALAAFATQSGIDVGAGGAGLARERSGGVSGRMNPARALDQILGGTGWKARRIDGGFRLVARTHGAPKAAVIAAAAAPPPPLATDIIVNANKYGTALHRFPGSGAVIQRHQLSLSMNGDDALADVVAQAPTLQSTALGAGRDKVFIRGIADSSFMGPTQSTTGVYFGEVQLAYNGPDPNLELYDIDRVEVLEGPQGTLYGAGAIGGVILISPRAPDLAHAAGSLTGGLTGTRGGAPGYDVSGTLNLPIATDRLGLRIVGYRSLDGGYIDDAERHLKNVNETKTTGGRAALRLAPGNGWTIEVGGLYQSIRSADSQYGLRDLPGLTRRSAIAQPFEDDFYLGRALVTKQWDNGITLLSATGFIRSAADDRYDATLVPQLPLAYDTHNRVSQITQEVRLSRSDSRGGGWTIGGNLLHDRDTIAREYGPLDQQRSITGVTNRTSTQALFGEGTIALTPALSLTGGVRFTHARTDSDPELASRGSTFVRGKSETRFDPTAGFNWALTKRIAWYGRYAKGFRTGGLAVASGVGRIGNFDSDSVRVVESGVRLAADGPRALSLTVAYSHAFWRHIQADLVNTRGFPFTANVGNGKIEGIESTAEWSPTTGLRLNGGVFYADARGIDRPNLPPGVRATRLPDTPRLSGTAGVVYQRAVAGGEGSAKLIGRYVGRSFLDPGALFNIRQGGYAYADLGASWTRRSLTIELTLANVLDTRGDRFALGNPFGVVNGDQYTPLRPRNLRIALTRTW